MPPGFGGQKDSFKDKYGEPNVDAATQILDAAGVQTPVKITLGYPPEHYGPNAVDEATELADQLNSSGLFDATIDDAAWEEYQTIYQGGRLRPLHPRLVPRLPGRRQLPVAVPP